MDWIFFYFRSVINSHKHFNVNGDDVIEINEYLYELTESEEESCNNSDDYESKVLTMEEKPDNEEDWW